MLSGLQLFDSVDERLRRAERDALAAQDEAEALGARLTQARHVQADCFRQLARLRAREIRDGGATLGRLDMAEEQVRQAVAQRSEASVAAEAKAAEARAALEQARAERDSMAGTLRAMEEHQQRALFGAETVAKADAEWQRLQAQALEAQRTAQLALQKAQLARQDLEQKGKPYLQDPLFAYLWKRGWGTSAYRQGSLSRALDGWVARVAGYDTARKSYALLSELPAGLEGHAQRMQEAAERANLALRERVHALAGLPPAAEGERAREALERAEAKVEQATQEFNAAEIARAAASSGEDARLAKAAERLAAALSQSSLAQLRDAAARTPTREDDEIVARLEAVSGDQAATERALAQARAEAEAARQRLIQVQHIRQEMRSRGYARDGWDFRDGAIIGILINDMLRGSISRGGFWDRMDQARVPGRGQGPWGGSDPWGGGGGSWGGGGGSWGGGGGGFGGGGFSTGGGFGGGGGFRSGGGF